MANAPLSDTTLWGANFTEANLTQADFHGANLFAADFRDARLESASFGAANLQHAKFWGEKSDLTGAKFCGADLIIIDEIDKAPRDFPNDILTEVEYMRFRVPELSDEYITASERYRPILILTSNSEKHLPDAFLRRCIYYNIPFPTLERLREIVLARLDFSGREKTQFLGQALDFFVGLRNDSVRLNKRPATAELLGWLDFLARRAHPKDLRSQADILEASLCCLIKSSDDTRRASEFLQDRVRNKK